MPKRVPKQAADKGFSSGSRNAASILAAFGANLPQGWDIRAKATDLLVKASRQSQESGVVKHSKYLTKTDSLVTG